jgi:hypothetical protein
MARIETKAPAPAGARVLPESETIMETETNTYATNTREELESALTRATERIGTLEDENRTLRFSQIEGSDTRLSDFWEKARRIAEHAGFCTEYDKIAIALGGPARQLDWSGVVNVSVTVTVPVPVGGTATPEEVENHTMEYEVDDWNVLDALRDAVGNMSQYDLDSEEDRYSLEVTDTEPAD